MPDTVKMARTRRAQVAQLLHLMQLTDYSAAVSKVRIEVTLKLNGSVSDVVQVARQVGQDVCEALEWRTFTYVEYVDELRRMLDMAVT